MATVQPGQTQSLLRLCAQDRTDPLVVTVTFSASAGPFVVDANDVLNARLHAVMGWGTGRGDASAELDIRQGTHITLAADVLTISARYSKGQGPFQRVSAFVAYGPSGSTTAPAVTFTDELITAGDQGTLGAPREIPAFAVGVAWFSPDDAEGASPPRATLQMVTDPRPNATVVMRASPPPHVFVPIPNGAHHMAIHNRGPASSRYALMYELSL